MIFLQKSVDLVKPALYYAHHFQHGSHRSALAQSVEQMTVNHWVAGSSPAGGAKLNKKGCMKMRPFLCVKEKLFWPSQYCQNLIHLWSL